MFGIEVLLLCSFCFDAMILPRRRVNFPASTILGSSGACATSIFDRVSSGSMRGRRKEEEARRKWWELGGEQRWMEEESGCFWHGNSTGSYKSAGFAFLLDGPRGSESEISYVRTPAKPPHIWFWFARKSWSKLRRRRMGSALDGFHGPDSPVQTVAGGLPFGIGDALSNMFDEFKAGSLHS